MKCAPYSSADLREPVTFQRLAEVADGAGGVEQVWQAIEGAPAWAKVTPVSGREYAQANRTNAATVLQVVVRHTDGIRASDVVVIRGLRCAITALPRDWQFRREWTEIDVAQGVAI